MFEFEVGNFKEYYWELNLTVKLIFFKVSKNVSLPKGVRFTN